MKYMFNFQRKIILTNETHFNAFHKTGIKYLIFRNTIYFVLSINTIFSFCDDLKGFKIVKIVQKLLNNAK